MQKINSFDGLIEKQKNFSALLSLRHKAEENIVETPKDGEKNIMVCGGTGCHASESQLLQQNLIDAIEEKGLSGKVKVITTGCFGFCEKGPIVKIHPDNVFYVEVTPEDATEIVEEHIIKGNRIERLLYEEPTLKKKVERHSDMSFYKKQKRIALRNCGFINPENIEEYIANRGYEALGKILSSSNPLELISTIKDSGLRGRGGGGFPTGLKWEITHKNKSDEKFIICNADEGDPGAFMDRSIMEGDPHTIIEAMALAGFAIGASQGYVYIRAEYPLAIQRLEIALEQAREAGMLGENIFGSEFSFNINLKLGAGAFICGEETALIHSIEGSRGEPTTKPPFPAESGLWSQPSNVNNVETLANVPPIILNGAEWFQSIGTETSKGTKVFALAGQINNVGLVEVPMGTTLREIIFEIGGGIKGGKEFKAVQTGGPSGGCISAEFLDTPIDYESLSQIGSMMGSGGMIVLSEDDCMVNIAKFYLEFTVDESCGKCAPCRVGTKRLHEMLEKITSGNGTEKDLVLLEELSETIKDTALCGLGQTAPNPVLSTLKYFKNEFLSHVVDKKCPAGSCQKLVRYEIITDKCVGCTACARVCPVSCIAGERKKPHVIDQSKCIKCGACYEACKFAAINKA
jgi:NADH:ubiquinone oxidoreductase subunit F (NADH-binding)/(2Fe-2S) ferredoxin/NAD-dependent dihydropyrimidine dehydrogenase PreA subunit